MARHGKGTFVQKVQLELELYREDGEYITDDDEKNITFVLEEADYDDIEIKIIDEYAIVNATMTIEGAYEWEDASYDCPGWEESDEMTDDDISHSLHEILDALKEYDITYEGYNFRSGSERKEIK